MVRPIGTVVLTAGIETVITLETTGTTGFVILDAIQLVLEDGVPNPARCFQEGISPSASYTHDATYVRSNDASGNFNDNGQLIAGATEGGSPDVLRSFLEFDIRSLPVSTSIGPVSLDLTTYTMPGINNVDGPGAVTHFDLHTYAFDIDESTATWNAPGAGDGVAGGTAGSLLSSASLDVEITGQPVVFADTPAFRAAVAGALAGDGFLRLVLKNRDETTGTHNFARFSDETANPSSHRPKLQIVLDDAIVRIDYTGTAAEITFSSVPGKTYRVESKQDLQDATWVLLVDRFDAQGLQTTYVDTTSAGSDRVYYRVTEND